jgi:hypothetical protein
MIRSFQTASSVVCCKATPMGSKKVFYGWRVLGALFLITAYISGIVSYGFTSVFKPIADEFAWSYARAAS